MANSNDKWNIQNGYGTSVINSSGYDTVFGGNVGIGQAPVAMNTLRLGEETITERYIKNLPLLTGGVPELVEKAIFDLYQSECVSDRIAAAAHHATPISVLIMMQGDPHDAVREIINMRLQGAGVYES